MSHEFLTEDGIFKTREFIEEIEYWAEIIDSALSETNPVATGVRLARLANRIEEVAEDFKGDGA